MDKIPSQRRQARKKDERNWQRKKILDAGLDVFARNGYEGTSVREIAEISGFSVGHIYNLIGKKEELFDQLLLQEGCDFEGVLLSLTERLSQQPAIEILDQLIVEILSYFQERPALFQIYLNETGAVLAAIDTHFSKRVLRLRGRLQKQIVTLFKRAFEEGSVIEIDPEHMRIAFFQLLNGFLGAWALARYRYPVVNEAETIRQIIWSGLRSK
ncbi:MAG: TetR/AcrR family transcriptional regulator [Candidatus Eisenbacteria bacterium]|nr:TetR/AcrR family transcriptional regulator [Candidatus Eisenbacteria bacterium]